MSKTPTLKNKSPTTNRSSPLPAPTDAEKAQIKALSEKISADTAEPDTSGNGREIDSLGMVMQKRDAAAVLATLWDVNDASTSLLMSDFYRRWAATPGIAKIEALRQAQISMLRGANAPSSNSTSGRGVQIESAPVATTTATYAHPYYWAPFVLIGNFR